MKTTALIVSAALLIPGTAFAQTVKEMYNYSAPSGIFSEGTAKWQMFRTMHEDRERLEAMRRGADPSTVGSIQSGPQGGSVSNETARGPAPAGRRGAVRPQ